MKYEIKIAWYPSKNLKAIDQTIGFCYDKKKAYKVVAHIAKVFSNYRTINYNCIELRNNKHEEIFGKIAIIEYLDKMQRKYGPFKKHLLVLGKTKAMSK